MILKSLSRTILLDIEGKEQEKYKLFGNLMYFRLGHSQENYTAQRYLVFPLYFIHIFNKEEI